MTVLAPLVKSVEVACDVSRAFEVFTRDIDRWWPVAGHSLREDRVERVEFEERLGGRILERWHDGTECAWGEVRIWDPPHRVAFSWLPNPDTGHATEVEVTFRPSETGTTVTLEHGGWDPEVDDERRKNYDSGWEGVLDLYARATS